MAFNKELPEWKAAGIEPPLTKRNEGWKPGEKPPADWLNWTQNRTYEALKELQEKAAEITSIQSLSVKSDVRVGTTENITLSGIQTINGVAVIAEDRILVKNQSTGNQNGIYVVKAGAWARAADADTSAKLANGIEVFVREGTVGRQTLWRMTNTGTVILGSTALTFQQTEAPLVSPALTGIPTAPTATAGSNNAQIATTAYVDSVVATSPAATPLNLGYGLQVVSVPRNTPYNLLNITGRTLINLLGRDGNCEDVSKWGVSFGTLAAETNNKVYGNNGIKVTISSGTQAVGYNTNVQPCVVGKKYISIADIKNGTATNGQANMQGAGSGFSVTSTTAFGISYLKFTATATTHYPQLVVNGSVGQYAYFDGFRVYELSTADYNAIDSMTADQIAAKYPYVDDMKPITAPYVIKSGENLLPPMTEWVRGAANIDIPSAYTMSIQSLASSSDYTQVGEFPVLPNTDYTYSATHNGKLNIYGIQSGTALVSASALQSVSFNTGSNTQINIAFLSGSAAGKYTIDRPMLNLGSTALPFKPKADDYLLFPNAQLASNVDNTIYDTLYKRDGKYWKLSRFKTMDLTGDLVIIWNNDGVGFKRVGLPIANAVAGIAGGAVLVKYDGKIIKVSADIGTSLGASDNFYMCSNGSAYFDIPDVDSGWGESYAPSTGEIQAYFYGWKMSSTNTSSPAPYTGLGNKYWYSIGSVPLDSQWYTSANVTPITQILKPYRLQYQLAMPTVEEIAVEGDITLHEGLNQIEVGNGLIVRERVNPNFDGGTKSYSFNAGGGTYDASKLKFRNLRTVTIYRGNEVDLRWIHYPVGSVLTQYGQWENIKDYNYDPTAAYTVTYLALDQYSLTSNVQSIQGEYASNLKTVVDRLTENQADVTTRVGVLENTKAQKEKTQWITPTLLNGWVNVGSLFATASYYKDNGFVRLRGAIKSGTASTNVPIFVLPQGYRPSSRELFAVYSGDGTVIGTAQVFDDGRVMFISGNNMSFSLSNILFLAEQ